MTIVLHCRNARDLRTPEEQRIGSRLRQFDSNDDFLVALEIGALLRRPPYSKY